jgi:hypothetical protein
VVVHILSRQLQISLTCTSTTLAPRLDLQIREIMLESFTADLSHSAGSTAATVDSSLHLATSYAINARSQELQRNPAAQIAGLNSLAPQRGTATWRTRSASNAETHRIHTIFLYTLRVIFTLSFVLHCLEYHFIGLFWCFRKEYWGGIRKTCWGLGNSFFVERCKQGKTGPALSCV